MQCCLEKTSHPQPTQVSSQKQAYFFHNQIWAVNTTPQEVKPQMACLPKATPITKGMPTQAAPHITGPTYMPFICEKACQQSYYYTIVYECQASYIWFNLDNQFYKKCLIYR